MKTTAKRKRTVLCVRIAEEACEMLPAIRVMMTKRLGAVPSKADVIEEAVRCLNHRELQMSGKAKR